MRDFIDVFVPFVVVVAFVCGFSNWYGSYQCDKYESITGKETKWVTLDECYVNTKNGWQRWDEYKLRAAGSEGLKHAP